MGTAVPQRIGRHVHPDARPDLPPPPAPTGIDYLGVVAAQHRAQIAARINYTDLPADPGPGPVAGPGPEPAALTDPAEPSHATRSPTRSPVSGQVPEQIPGQLDLTELIDPGDDALDAAGRSR